MTTYKLVPLDTHGKEINPIIDRYNWIAFDQEHIGKLIEAIPAIKLFAENAKLENKLSLLTGEYVGKEHIVYDREKSIDWFIAYLEQFPNALQQALSKKIVDEEKKKIGQ